MADKKDEKHEFLEVYELSDGTYQMVRVDAPTANKIKITPYEPVVEQYIANLIRNVNDMKNLQERKKVIAQKLEEMLG
jgi:hypothetical protein